MQKAKIGFTALVAVALMTPSTVWAQTTATTGGLNTANTTTGTGVNAQTTTGISALPSAATMSGASNPAALAAANIEAQELQAMEAQEQGAEMAMIGAAFSAGMAGVTCSQQPPNPTCPLWILGAVTSAAMGASMANAANTSLQGATDAANNTGIGTTSGSDGSASQTAVTSAVTSAATAAGITPPTADGTVSLGDGRTINAADAGSDSKLASAGLSPSEIAQFHDVMSQISKAAEKGAISPSKSMDGDSGVGGPSTVASETAKGKAAATSRINRDPAQIAGLSKNFNGDPIGVASENLFTLVNRRYSLKAEQNNLLTVPLKTATTPTRAQ